MQGSAAGILYDILRGFRRLLRAGPVLTGVLDVLFGLLSLLPAALLVGSLSHEGLRPYMLMGMASGPALYLAGSAGGQALLRLLGRAGRRFLETGPGRAIAHIGQKIGK